VGTLITFSSDYGPTDEFVGVCHLVIARIAPDVRVIDVAHGIRGIRGGSAVLAQSLVEAPVGAVHLAVVDPGVGTDRRAVVIACGNGSMLVGPDNGIFFPVADLLGGVVAAHELTEASLRGPALSRTFHGRDVFAPAAAHLATGVEPSAFGAPVGDLVRLPPPDVRVGDHALECDVLRTDWFGNLQLSATEADLVGSSLSGRVLVNGVEAMVGEKFADVAEGELLVYVNSAGHVAIACNGAAARELLHDPDRVTLSAKT
jgi:hypothetical protein